MREKEDIKKIIDEACYLLGIKGKELATELDISPSYLSDIRNGNKPATNIIAKIDSLLLAKGVKRSEYNSPPEEETPQEETPNIGTMINSIHSLCESIKSLVEMNKEEGRRTDKVLEILQQELDKKRG